MISSSFLIAPLVLAASSMAHPLTSRATGDVRLSDWASHSPPLESYWRFKNRFISLGCSSQQGTDFYTNCCYPLEASQSLASRPAECTPATSWCSASASASVQAQAVTPSSSSAAPAYTDSNAGSSNNNNNNNNNGYVDSVDDDENLPLCEDPNDDGEWHDDDYDTYTSSSSQPAATSSSSSPDDYDAYTFSSEPAATSSSSYTPDPAPVETAQPQPDYSSANTSGNTNTGNTGNTGSTGNTGGSSTGEVYTNGWATYFWQGGNAGACGVYHADSDYIAALDTRMFGTDYSHLSSWCGRTVRVTNTNNGKTVDVMIQDACPTCDTSTSLDLSHGAFLAIAQESEGHVPITWTPLY